MGTFTLARSVIILAPYFVTFEDGTYSVSLTGGNSNVQSRTTVNGVQVLPNNSGGLVLAGSGVLPSDVTAIADAVWDEATADHVSSGSVGKVISDTLDFSTLIKQRMGLDLSVPVTITENQISFGSVVIDISGDGETISVLTRSS